MIYLLTGENTFLLEQRLKELVVGFPGDIEKIDGQELTPEQLPDLLQGATLFSSERLIVIKNVSSNRTVWTDLADKLEQGVENTIVFVEQHPDKRTKTYKWLEKHAELQVTTELNTQEAVKWLRDEAVGRGMELDSQTAEFMIDYVGTDQWRLSSELEKVRLSGREVNKETIRELVEPTPQATTFELLDAAFAGRHEDIVTLLRTLKRSEDPYMFFGLLASQIYALMAVKSGQGNRPEQIAKDVGVHPFVIKKISPLARQLSPPVSRQLVAKLAELDVNMKSRAIDPWTQLESFLLALPTV